MEQNIYLPVGVVALFLVLLGLEQLVPLRPHTRALWGRLLLNGCVTALAFVSATVFVKPAIDWAMQRSSPECPFGLIHLVDLPAPLRVNFAILLMDLAFY